MDHLLWLRILFESINRTSLEVKSENWGAKGREKGGLKHEEKGSRVDDMGLRRNCHEVEEKAVIVVDLREFSSSYFGR